MIYKDITKGFEAREKIKKGIDKAADAVRPTLGAVGMSALIDIGDFDPIESDDGITVLKHLTFKDRFEHIGLRMLRKAANRTNEEGGDGTSTTVVITQALAEAAFKEIGHNQEKIPEIIERLENGLVECVEFLNLHKQEVKDEDIERVATIASLDHEIGAIIADAYKQVGKDGIVTIENSATLGYSSEVVKGIRFQKGFISPYFINDQEKNQTVLEHPYVLVVNRRVAINQQIAKIMDEIIKSGNNNILLIADNVEGEALASLVLNHQRKAINICCVQPPFTLDRNKEWMKDVAVLTGGTVVTEEAGILMDNIGIGYLGQAERVIVTKDHTTIINGAGEKEAIEERLKSLKGQLEGETSEYAKQMLRERIASFTGGIGVIRVGAMTDTELKAKKFKIEDAVNATKAALEEGIVIGGGACLAQIASSMSDSMFKEALVAPIKQMAINAGKFDTGFIAWIKKLFGYLSVNQLVNKVSKLDNLPDGAGYNFKTKQYERLFLSGVIDPLKVTRLAVESAVSVTKSLVRGETVVTEIDNTND